MTLLYMTTEETVQLRQVLKEYLQDLEAEMAGCGEEERAELVRTRAALLAIVGELRGEGA